MNRRWVVPITALAAVTAGVVGTAVAGAFDESQAVEACVSKSSGTVRVVDPGTGCRSSENALAWNKQGPVGPQGPEGPQGPAGEPGGLAAVHIETSDYDLSAGERRRMGATCPTGYQVTGGGFQVNTPFETVHSVRSSLPDTATHWVVELTNRDTFSFGVTVYAVCVPTGA